MAESPLRRAAFLCIERKGAGRKTFPRPTYGRNDATIERHARRRACSVSLIAALSPLVKIGCQSGLLNQFVKHSRAPFSVSLRYLFHTQTARQMAHRHRHCEKRSENHRVFQGADVKGKARRDENSVPRQCAGRSHKKNWPAPELQPSDDNQEKIERGNRGVARQGLKNQ